MAPNAPPTPEYQAHELASERQGAQAVETGMSQQPGPPPQQPQADLSQQVVPPAVQPVDPAIVDPQTPIIADDSDLIEKEWVLKAKEIVARTRHDPYQQNKEVERMKADYMKKRYNKDVRVTEE